MGSLFYNYNNDSQKDNKVKIKLRLTKIKRTSKMDQE